MNADKINRWLSLVANIAVVTGIVFVALQINQNNRMMRTQTRNAITASILEFQSNSETSGLRDVARKGNRDPSSFTADEIDKVLQLYVGNLRLWENIHYQYRNGVFDEEEFAAERNTWKALGERTPQLRTVYCLLKQNHALSPAFVAEMDKLAYGAPGSCDAAFDLLRATQGAAQH